MSEPKITFDSCQYLNTNRTQVIADLKEYIAFPSVAAMPEHSADCRACADWLVSWLSRHGLSSEIIETSSGGQPIVFAHYQTDPALPTLLIYGHYDVQPAQISDGWDSNPFKLSFAPDGDTFVARGAGDNKGQTFYVLQAVASLINSNKLKFNLKVMIEGEEEIGSAHTLAALPALSTKLAAEAAIVCDDLLFTRDQPVVSVGMRGIFAFNIVLNGSHTDLHSGLFGGLVKNPATELVRLISSLYQSDGTIALPEFYQEVAAPTAADHQLIADLPDRRDFAREALGAALTGAETGIDPLVSNMFRPTIELNGIDSGYVGSGSKSIIPKSASANFTCRIVAGQDPAVLFSAIKKHLSAKTPAGLTLNFSYYEAGCPGYRSETLTKFQKTAANILSEQFANPALFYCSPATIPIIPDLAELVQNNIVVTGFGYDTDNWHGANECFSLDRIARGFTFIRKLLSSEF